jgi:CDGSH-type Zn-finger protein
MAREVTHDATGPTPIGEDDLEERGGQVFVCRCGLSDDKPFCDGSHTAVADEEEGVSYKYEDDDDENPRHAIEEIVFAED